MLREIFSDIDWDSCRVSFVIFQKVIFTSWHTDGYGVAFWSFFPLEWRSTTSFCLSAICMHHLYKAVLRKIINYLFNWNLKNIERKININQCRVSQLNRTRLIGCDLGIDSIPANRLLMAGSNCSPGSRRACEIKMAPGCHDAYGTEFYDERATNR